MILTPSCDGLPDITECWDVLSEAVVAPCDEDLTRWPLTCDADLVKLEERLSILCKCPSAPPVQSDGAFCPM